MNSQKLNAAAHAAHLAAQLLVSAGCTDDTDELIASAEAALEEALEHLRYYEFVPRTNTSGWIDSSIQIAQGKTP